MYWQLLDPSISHVFTLKAIKHVWAWIFKRTHMNIAQQKHRHADSVLLDDSESMWFFWIIPTKYKNQRKPNQLCQLMLINRQGSLTVEPRVTENNGWPRSLIGWKRFLEFRRSQEERMEQSNTKGKWILFHFQGRESWNLNPISIYFKGKYLNIFRNRFIH